MATRRLGFLQSCACPVRQKLSIQTCQLMSLLLKQGLDPGTFCSCKHLPRESKEV